MNRGVFVLLLALAWAPQGSLADDTDEVTISAYQEDQCGALCLFIALRSLDVEVASVREIAERMGEPPAGGYSLAQLSGAAESYGLHTRGVETSAANLAKRTGRFACIAHYADGHYVNLLDAKPGLVHVIDAPQSMRVPAETFDQRWSRNALLISKQPILSEGELPVDWNWPLIIGVVVVAVTGVGVWILLRRRKPIAEP